jgi:hypothetical protein
LLEGGPCRAKTIAALLSIMAAVFIATFVIVIAM